MIRAFLIAAAASPLLTAQVVVLEKPMTPPEWAYAERALLKQSVDAAEEFAAKYIDPRGHFRAVERWGGNDGPDDVMETFANWPLAYALGADERLLTIYQRLWEGHLDQYQKAKAPSTDLAKNGMYWREFPVAFDWEHNGEGLAAFFHYGLCRPRDLTYRQRAIRFAHFYDGTDPLAPNYDKQHKIIRSLHNGSRGAKVTGASIFDWGGEAEPGVDRHTRYKTAANIRGDHPLNLIATTLGLNAYLLTGNEAHKTWALEYAGAWRDRVLANQGNVPTNIGLDGQIGGEWNGKWYGGTFGWNFDATTSTRNYYMRGIRIGMANAYLLTHDASYLEPLKRQLANLYAAQRIENGRVLLPNKYGDNGWWGYLPNQHFDVQRDLWLFAMDTAQPPARLVAGDPWIAYLAGQRPGYPEEALRQSLADLRRRVAGFRNDASTPDQRASDHAQRFTPVHTTALVNLMLGANDPGGSGNLVHARLRYFDPDRRRAGLPEDVAALVDTIEPEAVSVTLVNLSQTQERNIVVQTGAYAEHTALAVTADGRTQPVNASHFSVRLAHGAGAKLRITMKRYANQPTLAFPWD